MPIARFTTKARTVSASTAAMRNRKSSRCGKIPSATISVVRSAWCAGRQRQRDRRGEYAVRPDVRTQRHAEQARDRQRHVAGCSAHEVTDEHVAR